MLENNRSKKEMLINEKIVEERIKERSSKLELIPINYYVLKASTTTFNPVDGATYYFGSLLWSVNTNEGYAKFYVPLKSKLKRVDIFCYSNGNASNENIAHYVRKNGSSDISLGNANFGGTQFLRLVKTDLSVIFEDTDYFEIKIVCPTWATNPTNWLHNVNLLFEVL